MRSDFSLNNIAIDPHTIKACYSLDVVHTSFILVRKTFEFEIRISGFSL